MKRRPPHAREQIDWEAARRRLQAAKIAPDALRERATLILAERAARLASVATDTRESGSGSLEVLTFQCGSTRFALESRVVIEVGHCGRLSRVPGARPALLGVTNLRSELLPVFELNAIIGGNGSERPRAAQLIVLGDGEPEFGVLADVVDEVARLAPADLSDSRSVGAMAHPEYVLGISGDGRVLLDGGALMRDRSVFVAKRVSGLGPEREAS